MKFVLFRNLKIYIISYLCNSLASKKMDNSKILQHITDLFNFQFSEKIIDIELLPGAGSSRRYYRIHSELPQNIMACAGTDIEENKTFIYFSTRLHQAGINVPEILGNYKNEIYLTTDLGNTDVLHAKEGLSNHETIELYKRILQDLIQIQILGGKIIDFSQSFVRPEFDRTAMLWDLYYFKYYYLKITGLEFNEQKLEVDYNRLLDFLETADRSYFMYRDFQARNIMLNNGKLGYLDFQGGMKGPLQYDVVSLLYQAKANLDTETRETLLKFYIKELQKHITIDETVFRKQYQAFVFIRILQTLGAYGFRGYIQQKEHFIQSIPLALQNVKQHVHIINAIVPMPYLSSLIEQLTEIKPTL